MGGVTIADPLVSVVLCGYNQAPYLRQSVESVLGQTYPNVELILMDNGSTDDSRDIARQYGSLPNVRLLLHEDAASIGLRSNEGIAASSGDFISFLWADDWYLPRKTEVQMEAFAHLTPEHGVVNSPGYRYNVRTRQRWHDGTPEWSGWVLERMLLDFHRAWLNMDSPLVRRECFLRSPFYEDVFLEAEAIYLRLATRYQFHFVPEPLVVTRDHDTNLGKAYEYMTKWNLLCLQRLEREAGFPTRLVPLLDHVRAVTVRNLGWRMVRLADEPKKGRMYLQESLRWGILNAVHPRYLAGMGLTFMPGPLRRSANGFANRLRGHRENIEYVRDIGVGGRFPIPED
jgi:glycosyltransferase involved in cell wall biosynthesis